MVNTCASMSLYYTFIPLIMVIIIGWTGGMLLHRYLSKKYRYICQNCNQSFRLTVTQSMFTLNKHYRGKMECPCCGTYTYVNIEKNNAQTLNLESTI